MKVKSNIFDKNKDKFHESKDSPEYDIERLIILEAKRLVEKYGNDCFNVAQLKQIMNIGENNVYQLLENELPYKKIGKRKVVPAINLARWLLSQQKSS